MAALFHIIQAFQMQVCMPIEFPSSTKLSLAIGLKIQSYLTPAFGLNLSTAQELLGKMEKEMKAKVDINDILSGHCLSDDSAKELAEPLNDITENILQLMKHFMPVPLTNIFRHEAWRQSVFKNIKDDNVGLHASCSLHHIMNEYTVTLFLYSDGAINVITKLAAIIGQINTKVSKI